MEHIQKEITKVVLFAAVSLLGISCYSQDGSEATKKSSFTTEILVDQAPAEVFKVIKNVRSWWSGAYREEIIGKSDKLNDEFSIRAGGGAHYSRQKLVELVPNKKIVWLVTDSNLSFVKDGREWNGTKISFEISEFENKTKVVFSHIGLFPEMECYTSCTPAWTQYIQGTLLNLLTKK